MDAVLACDAVTRWYGQVIGVNGVTCEIGPGVTGLLGLNGAGKSTLFKVMAGQLRPSKGRVLLLGHDLARHTGLYRWIGFCPEPDALYESMTGREMLVYLLRLHGFSQSDAADRAAAALERTHLTEDADRRVAGYSKGMRQKIKLAQAMAHDPKVMFLDEPFNGMDPVSRHESMALIRELGEEGKTVLVSSHILHEVEQMTSTILLIQNGRILAEGHVSDIRDLIERHPHQVRIACDQPRRLAATLVAKEDVQGVRVEPDGEHVIVETNRPRTFFASLPLIALEGETRIRGYTTADDDLKSLFEYLVEDAS
jgi:ABC-2 type transport system ATP-binding protein